MDRPSITTHLIAGAIFMTLPVWVAFASSTHAPETILREGLQILPGPHLFQTYNEVLFIEGGVMKQVTATIDRRYTAERDGILGVFESNENG